MTPRDETGDWRVDQAEVWARTVLRVLGTRYPYATGHVTTGRDDTRLDPVELHPAFHGSFDWHSSVHMLWSAVRLLTLAPDQLEAGTRDDLVALLDERLSVEHCAAEVAYLRADPSYERPYGWAWAAMLAAATTSCPLPRARSWTAATAPLAGLVAELLLDWMPRLAYPVRHGVHANTAFAASLAHQAFTTLGRPDLVGAVGAHARRWFGADRDHPTRWEPSGGDFLSPALCEADLMQRVLPPDELADWLPGFLPGLAADGDPLLGSPAVLDPTDGQLGHLLGLALSRAWQLRRLAPHLDAARGDRIATATAEQVRLVETQIVSGDFMVTHWLVSFALLAVTADQRGGHPG